MKTLTSKCLWQEWQLSSRCFSGMTTPQCLLVLLARILHKPTLFFLPLSPFSSLSLFVLTNCSVFIHIQEELKHFWERSSERWIWQIWCRAWGKARRTQSPFTFANSSREPLLCQGITPKCSDSSLKLFTDTARTVYSHRWEWEGTGCCNLGNQVRCDGPTPVHESAASPRKCWGFPANWVSPQGWRPDALNKEPQTRC